MKIFKNIIQSWRHHLTLQIATTIVLSASFTVVISVFTLSKNLMSILSLWGDSMQMSVYLNEDIQVDDLSKIENFLKTNTNVGSIKFVSKEDAVHLFEDQLSSYAPDLVKDKDLVRFVPASYQFGLSKSIDILNQLPTMTELANTLKSYSGIEDVSYGQDWVKSFSSISNTLIAGGSIFILVIISSAIFVIANSIHSSISQRKTEIEVLELVGATNSFIRRPFLIEGALIGLITTGFGLVTTYLIFLAIKDFLHTQISFLQISTHLSFLNSNQILSALFLGFLLGLISSWLCVKKINNGWSASMSTRN